MGVSRGVSGRAGRGGSEELVSWFSGSGKLFLDFVGEVLFSFPMIRNITEEYQGTGGENLNSMIETLL